MVLHTILYAAVYSETDSLVQNTAVIHLCFSSVLYINLYMQVLVLSIICGMWKRLKENLINGLSESRRTASQNIKC